MGRKRIDERRHARIERTASLGERFVGLEHDRELDDVEAADPDQGAGALPRRDALRVRERVSDFPETYQPERGRQVEPRRERRSHAHVQRHGYSCTFQALQL